MSEELGFESSSLNGSSLLHYAGVLQNKTDSCVDLQNEKIKVQNQMHLKKSDVRWDLCFLKPDNFLREYTILYVCIPF